MDSRVSSDSKGTTIVLLPKGMAVVDDDAGVELLAVRWRLDARTRNRPRAFTYLRTHAGTRRLYLERLVMEAPKGKFVRFLNRNTLDARRANLEVVTFRREVFLPDQCQRDDWAVEEFRNGGRYNPQRRREDAWRIWCERGGPISLGEIATALRSNTTTIKQDIMAMGADPLAAAI